MKHRYIIIIINSHIVLAYGGWTSKSHRALRRTRLVKYYVSHLSWHLVSETRVGFFYRSPSGRSIAISLSWLL